VTNSLSATDYPWALLWLGLALATAGLAEQKNRSRWTWFVLAVVLGPLATALVVVWPRVEGSRSPKLDLLRNAADRYLLGAAALLAVLIVSLAGLISVGAALASAGGDEGVVVVGDPSPWWLLAMFAGALVLSAWAFWFFLRRHNRARALSRRLDSRLENDA
jgi:membrane protein implicated in regulation of membrane protease activity